MNESILIVMMVIRGELHRTSWLVLHLRDVDSSTALETQSDFRHDGGV